MVKDDLAAFQAVCDIYDDCSRWQAIKDFFNTVPSHTAYWSLFVTASILIFASILTGILFTVAGDAQKDNIVFSIMGLMLGVAIVYGYLLKKHGVGKEKAYPYRSLLTQTFYQHERYFMFKDKLKTKFYHNVPSFENVKKLIQSRLQQDQGLGAFRIWLLGISASILVAIIYSLAPSGTDEKLIYIVVVSFYLLLSLLFVYVVHDPLWNKNNKYRELLLFITIYESDVVTEDSNQREQKGSEPLISLNLKVQ